MEYLGHRIDSEGIHATPEKLDAIANALPPSNVQELRSFLGMVNYYGKFIPNLSTILAPPNALLHKDSSWIWSQAGQSAFDACKKALMSSTVLAHYDVNLPIKVAADASAYGIGAVLSHVDPDGSERPGAFASCTLSSSERNYTQIEKEALSLIFAVKRFHQNLYGRRFTLLTDHKPLTTILGPKQGIPLLAAIRLQHWANLRAAYQYTTEQFKATLDHANADAMSRLPLPVFPQLMVNRMHSVSCLARCRPCLSPWNN